MCKHLLLLLLLLRKKMDKTDVKLCFSKQYKQYRMTTEGTVGSWSVSELAKTERRRALTGAVAIASVVPRDLSVRLTGASYYFLTSWRSPNLFCKMLSLLHVVQ